MISMTYSTHLQRRTVVALTAGWASGSRGFGSVHAYPCGCLVGGGGNKSFFVLRELGTERGEGGQVLA